MAGSIEGRGKEHAYWMGCLFVRPFYWWFWFAGGQQPEEPASADHSPRGINTHTRLLKEEAVVGDWGSKVLGERINLAKTTQQLRMKLLVQVYIHDMTKQLRGCSMQLTSFRSHCQPLQLL
mmetsp:Transcript_58195/g.127722  ORF Transcript_58195/g.127722 Transcript_58195/m.127722 type:complete len:121 (-) Transcript_58195:761-1123(-)